VIALNQFVSRCALVILLVAMIGCTTQSAPRPETLTRAPFAPASHSIKRDATTPLLAVSSGGAPGSVIVFLTTDNGDVVPQKVISGFHTSLNYPSGLIVSSSGGIIVLREGFPSKTKISFFNRTAHGDVRPYRQIGCMYGPDSDLIRDVAGNFYVSGFGDTIQVYASNAKGCSGPIRWIQGPHTQLSATQGIVFDQSGNLLVANVTQGHGITVYAPGATGDASPIRQIAGPSTGFSYPQAVGLDAAGLIYVSNCAQEQYNSQCNIEVFPANANGDVAPIRNIQGDLTGLFESISMAVDSAGTIYVANYYTSVIAVFAPGADGNVAPLRTISGPNTGIMAPVGIAIQR
jgi:hypothetical protein